MSGEDRIKLYPRNERELREALQALVDRYPESEESAETLQGANLIKQASLAIPEDLKGVAEASAVVLARQRAELSARPSAQNGKQAGKAAT